MFVQQSTNGIKREWNWKYDEGRLEVTGTKRVDIISAQYKAKLALVQYQFWLIAKSV